MKHFASIFFVVLCVDLLFASKAKAEVHIESQPSPWKIESTNYQAQVDGDGCLSTLQVYGKEFLAANVSISRGCYFFHAGPLQLTEIAKTNTDVILAKGELTSVEYKFSKQGIEWQLANHSDVELVFFVVFAGGIEGFRSGDVEINSAPISAESRSLSCYREGVRVDFDGFSRIWGPWQGPHQVGQVDLKPGEKKILKVRFNKASTEEQQEILNLHAVPADPEISILSPRPYQVFQRQTIRAGDALISGRCNVEAEEVAIRIIGESQYGPISDEWITSPVLSSIREFNAVIPLAAGGWYSLEVRALNESKVVAEERVERFGMGEIFVGAGQSNSTNSGEIKTKQITGMVSSFSGENWQLADDPQPGVADRTQGGSFWPAFGDAMYKKYKVPIGVATTGYGGTSVNQWQPEGVLFTNWMMARVHQLGPKGFRALLWHQGESDVEMVSDEYYNKLKKVIIESRKKAGWEFPWFVAQASYHSADRPRFDNIRDAQKRLWQESVALQGPDTDTLMGDHRDLGGKGIHFSPKGLKAHGEMWADEVGAYLDEVLAAEN